MSRTVQLAFACAVLVAACESDGPSPASAASAVEESVPSEHYVRDEVTDDLTVRIVVPKEARAIDGLGERLVGEADNELGHVIRRAAEQRREAPSLFTASNLNIEWSVAYDGPDALSLLGETRVSEGGFTSPMTRESVLYDRRAGREIGFADLFSDPRASGPAMRAVSDAAFAAWVETSPRARNDLALVDERTLVDARESLRPRPRSFQTFVFVPAAHAPERIAAIRLYYAEGALGPREDGPMVLEIPAETLASHFAPRWAALVAPAAP